MKSLSLSGPPPRRGSLVQQLGARPAKWAVRQAAARAVVLEEARAAVLEEAWVAVGVRAEAWVARAAGPAQAADQRARWRASLPNWIYSRKDCTSSGLPSNESTFHAS